MKVKHGNKNQTLEPHNFSLFNFQLNEIRTLIIDDQSEVPQKNCNSPTELLLSHLQLKSVIWLICRSQINRFEHGKCTTTGFGVIQLILSETWTDFSWVKFTICFSLKKITRKGTSKTPQLV